MTGCVLGNYVWIEKPNTSNRSWPVRVNVKLFFWPDYSGSQSAARVVILFLIVWRAAKPLCWCCLFCPSHTPPASVYVCLSWHAVACRRGCCKRLWHGTVNYCKLVTSTRSVVSPWSGVIPTAGNDPKSYSSQSRYKFVKIICVKGVCIVLKLGL